jgi:hypothetical protein
MQKHQTPFDILTNISVHKRKETMTSRKHGVNILHRTWPLWNINWNMTNTYQIKLMGENTAKTFSDYADTCKHTER